MASTYPIDEESSGIFDRFSFDWVNKIVRAGRKGELEEQDLPLPKDQRAELNFERFQKEWEKELQQVSQKPPSILKVLWSLYKSEIMLGGLFKLLWSLFVIMGAFFFVRSLLQYVDTSVTSPYDSDIAGWILVAGFFLDAWLLGEPLLPHCSSLACSKHNRHCNASEKNRIGSD